MQGLCTFGSIVWAYVPKVNQKKLDATSIQCIMLGYAEGQKAYWLWVPTKWKIIHAKSIYFDEDTSFQGCTYDSLPFVDLFTNQPPTTSKPETSQVNTSPNLVHTGM